MYSAFHSVYPIFIIFIIPKLVYLFRPRVTRSAAPEYWRWWIERITVTYEPRIVYNGTLKDFSTLFGVRWIVNWLIDHNISIRIEKRSYTSQLKVWLKYHFRWVLDWLFETYEDWINGQCRDLYDFRKFMQEHLVAGYHLPAKIESRTCVEDKISFNSVVGLKGQPQLYLFESRNWFWNLYQVEPMSSMEKKSNKVRWSLLCENFDHHFLK